MNRKKVINIVVILLLVNLVLPSGVVFASDGVAQLQIVSAYPMKSIQIIGSNQNGDVVDHTWEFGDSGTTVLTTLGWWWRIKYFCGIECWFGQYPDDPAPIVWVTYIDDETENEKCRNNDISTLANVSSCYFYYPGPGEDSGGPGDGGGSGDPGDPGDPVTLPGQITYSIVPAQVDLGDRAMMYFGVYNPNAATAITISDPRIQITTSIPARFSPLAASVFLDPQTIAAHRTNRFMGAPNAMYYRWMDGSYPVFKMCSEQGGEKFIKDFSEAVGWALAGQVVDSGSAAYVEWLNSNSIALTRDGLLALQKLDLTVWALPLVLDMDDGIVNLMTIHTGGLENYILPQGSFTYTPQIDGGIQGPSRNVLVNVPQEYQTSLANGMDALRLTIPTMASAKLISGLADFSPATPPWIGPAVAYTDGMAMMISCYPISVAYSTPLDGEIIYPNGPTSSLNMRARVSAATMSQHLQESVNDVQSETLYIQYRDVLNSLIKLEQILIQAGTEAGMSPNPGEMKKFNQTVLPYIDDVNVKLLLIQQTIDADTSGFYDGMLVDIDLASQLLQNMQSALSSKDPRRVHCLSVMSQNPPITGNGAKLYGTPGNDVILGNQHGNTIYAGDGNDCIIAGNGTDIIYAGGGNDIIYAGNGPDSIFGEAGTDFLDGENGPDRFDGGDDIDFGINKDRPDVLMNVEYMMK